jgi:asparagine synthase (glutamine-hydrolysing)
MCGIAGIISSKPPAVEKIIASLRAMTDAITHRGPDGEGIWINENSKVALGHRRLKIIDLSDQAAQPMHYADRYTITYNGEIYNYREIKKELQSKNYVFKSQSDTEVILAAYHCWKEECLLHFDGMFAFAIWDNNLQQLFCARDRFGEKPFYFYRDDEQFLFASEMKSLWAAAVQKKIMNTQLLNYITLGLVQDIARPDLTFFEGIFSLQPGHFLKLEVPTFDIRLSNYWDIDKESTDFAISQEEAIEKFSFLLKRSVHRRLRSDVPVGTSLSGGLDSSSIVSLICDLQSEGAHLPDFQTFSAVFPGYQKDESRYIDEIVQSFRILNSQTQPTAEELQKDFDRLMYHQEEPFQSLSIYAQFKVYETAAGQDIKVILDGQGADETLAGYHKYYPWYWQELYSKKQLSASGELKAAASLGIPIAWGLKNKLAAWMPGTAAAQLERNAFHKQVHSASIDPDFFSSGFNKLSLRKPIVRKLNDILYFHTCQLGLQELLRYADRNSMAHGREVRLPFLDHELVQFVFSLPSHFKIKEGWTKWILRKAMSDNLPENIVWRKDKVGFEPPQKLWMENKKMNEKIMDSREKLVKAHILKSSVLQQPIKAKDSHEDGNDDFRYLCAASMMESF